MDISHITKQYNKYINNILLISVRITDKLQDIIIDLDLIKQLNKIIKKYNNKKKINILNLLYDYNKNFKIIKQDLNFIINLYQNVDNEINIEYNKYINLIMNSNLITTLIKLDNKQKGGTSNNQQYDKIFNLLNEPYKHSKKSYNILKLLIYYPDIFISNDFIKLFYQELGNLKLDDVIESAYTHTTNIALCILQILHAKNILDKVSGITNELAKTNKHYLKIAECELIYKKEILKGLNLTEPKDPKYEDLWNNTMNKITAEIKELEEKIIELKEKEAELEDAEAEERNIKEANERKIKEAKERNAIEAKYYAKKKELINKFNAIAGHIILNDECLTAKCIKEILITEFPILDSLKKFYERLKSI